MATDADAGKHGTTGTETAATTATSAAPRDEDSGLHDLRTLATRTRSRMTSQRTAIRDSEAEISTSSQALRAVALPEPAKMVSLPAPPTAAQLGEAVAAAARAAEARNAKPARTRGATSEPAVAGPATAASTAPAQSSSSNGKYIIGAIVAVAAAAAVVVVVTRPSTKTAPVAAPVVAVATVPKAAAPVAPAPPIAVAPVVAPPVVDQAPAAVEPTTKKPDAIVAKADAPASSKDKASKAADAPKADKAVAAKPGGKGDGESLDDLLGAAGDKAGKAAEAPKPEKKSLTSGDIKGAMGPLTKRAQACQGSTGANGSVSIKVIVSSNGKVKSAEATGAFAGTPAGDCVAKVARQASFPAWDGAPTITVTYAYFLAE